MMPEFCNVSRKTRMGFICLQPRKIQDILNRRTNKCKPKYILVNMKYSCWHVLYKINRWGKGIHSDNKMSFLSHLLFYSPSPPEGWKPSKTFFISKKRYWQSTSIVLTSPGSFVTTQIQFCNSSDTPFSMEQHKFHACTYMLSVSQTGLLEPESVAPERLSVIQ